jgi:replicative DNA helicase
VSASASLETVRPSPIVVPGGRLPPQNLDAERSVLGGVLLDNAALNDVLELLKPEDFYRDAHRKVFEAMCALSSRGEPIDRVTLKDELTALGAYEAVGGEDFIDLLDKLVPSAANLTYYAKIVHEKALARRVIEAAHAIATQGYEQAGEVSEFLDDAERRIFAITEEKAQSAFTHVREVVKSTFKVIEHLYERQEEITGISTGFADLDRLTSGFQPGDLVILAARPSMGKTAYCLNVATHVGCRAQYKGKRIGVGIFSLEMPKEQLVMRMLSSEARVDSQRIRTGRLIESDWPKLAHAAGALADANIHIDDSPGLSALELRAKSRRLAGRFAESDAPLGLVVVDYLQLMKGNERIESREQQISEISRSLKALSKELNIPVLALSQLNRSLEKRPDKRPQLSDLRECVTGDTLVVLADGRRIRIRELVGHEPEVLAVSPDRRIVPARAEEVWSVGKREVFEVALGSGRTIRCTSRHRLLTSDGWRRLEMLSVGDRVAISRSAAFRQAPSFGAAFRQNAPVADVSTSVAARSSDVSGIDWDRIVWIKAAGIEEVFDLTVPGPASWLADGIVSHNSGALEQDADTIIFLFREEVYEKDKEEVKGIAEIIVGKQRNGPIGTANAAFIHEFTRFENLARDYVPQSGD